MEELEADDDFRVLDVAPPAATKGKPLSAQEIKELDDAWESVFLIEERCVISSHALEWAIHTQVTTASKNLITSKAMPKV